jgi:rhamnosyltransferase
MYLSQDAEPSSVDWMQRLSSALVESHVAGAYARQIPRPDADPFSQFFLARTYGATPVRRRMDYSRRPRIGDIFFSNVSSALKRAVWQQVPFRDDVLMSEDQYWAYDVLRSGFEIAYEPTAQVRHSHNYSLRSLYARNWLSAASLRGLIADSRTGITRSAVSYIWEEAAYLVYQRKVHWLPYMLLYEATRSAGFACGSAGILGQRKRRTVRRQNRTAR